jgi:hypothetical protein
VDEIVENIHSLYTYASLDKMNEFNKKFLVLCQEDSLEKYVEFNNQLETIAKIYNVKYVE